MSEEITAENVGSYFNYQVLFAVALEKLGGELEITLEDSSSFKGFAFEPVEGSKTLKFVTVEG